MYYVTDTHSLIWYLAEDKKLGKKAFSLFEKADDGKATIIIPTIVLAEIISICEKKKVELRVKEIFGRIKDSLNYIPYNLDMETLESVITIKGVPEIHDKIIVATSLLTDSILITKDEEIINSGIVETIW